MMLLSASKQRCLLRKGPRIAKKDVEKIAHAINISIVNMNQYIDDSQVT
jgi:hypothetical protein